MEENEIGLAMSLNCLYKVGTKIKQTARTRLGN